MKILKFGGSSVASAERIRAVASIVVDSARHGAIAVVVSAFQGVTDSLIELSALAAKGDESFRSGLESLGQRHLSAVKELVPITQQSSVLATVKVWLNELEDILQGVFLVGECSKRMLDYIMSFGERLSAFILTAHLSGAGLSAEYLDARTLLRADESWGAGKIAQKESFAAIRDYFSRTERLQIITGFVAATPSQDTITLGRGGSDYTAALFGAALNASEIEIWSDVDGVMTADPRKVPKAFYIPCLSYEEMMELSHFGAKVIYPPTIQPALSQQIPVRIRNTFNPAFEGTVITDRLKPHRFMLTGISSIDQIALLRIEGSGMVGVAGISMRLFGALAREEISVILITQASSEHTICIAVQPKAASLAKRVIEQEFSLEIAAKIIDPVLVEHDLSIISAVGENMRRVPGLAGRLFSALGHNGINIVAIAQGSSELNISVVIPRLDEIKALNALHDEFFFTKTKSIHLFILGTGLIATTLLEQIRSHHLRLQEELFLDLKIVGLMNRSHHLIAPEGISLDAYEASLSQAPRGEVTEFVAQMCALNLPNAVFVDCTASEESTRCYLQVLSQSIAVVTPNKRAQSGDLAQFKELKALSRRRAVPFLYETSVGAGLPVISTLNDLLRSGDEIVSIEAVLSGTLSFIFNSLAPGVPFSTIVREAKTRGYTEPDPRDDLSGQDVARKILILAREIGLDLEREQVRVEDLCPASCRHASSIEEFFEALAKEDSALEVRLQEAAGRGKKLCYVATLAGGLAQVALQEIDMHHPFFHLSGSDNVISFRTKRYDHRPLVVQGPGAGAEVTAAGVFADIIRTAHLT